MAYSDAPWQNRVANAHKYWSNWHTKFKCDSLEQYYEGFQWKNKKDYSTVNYNPYTINLVYSTIKIKLASFLFQKPSYILSPRPGNSQWNLDFAVNSAYLKQDVLNTIIQNPNTNFTRHIKLAALDSFFRFGIVEVGYAADWRNPQKEMPYLKSWDDQDVSEGKDKVIEDNEVPVNERFFIKRIPPRRFRVGLSEATDLSDHEWCGYYEYFYTNELKRTKGIKWPKSAPTGLSGADYNTGILGNPSDGTDNPEFARLIGSGSITKVWNIFDMVSHKRCLYADGCWDEPLWDADMERLPLVDIRWDYRLEGFYPIPPVFQWLSPQDEINEAREQTRSYRRRFTRKFQFVEGQIDPEEVEKFTSGPDGIMIKVKQPDAITPIQNPEQGATAENALLIAKNDFNIISGTSAEVRGPSDRETATASKIVDARSQIRESADQMDFSVFMCSIGREILTQANEKLSEGIWVHWTNNPTDQPLQDMQVMQPIYKYVKAQEISDGHDFDIEVDVQNATPAAMAQTQQAFITFVSMVAKFPMLAMSPTLIRETAYRCGYRNEKVIRDMQQVAIAAMAAKQQMAGEQQALAGGGGDNASGNNAASTEVAQQATPGLEQIDNQLNNQIQ